MADTFECPQCGKQYPLERRLGGKAVACECGHRFLAPAAPRQSAPLVGLPIPPSTSPADPSYSAPGQPPSAGRAIPNAPRNPPQPARWAGTQSPDSPPADEAVPLTEADLFDEPPSAAPASAAPMVYAAAASPSALPPNRFKPPPRKENKKAKKEDNRRTSTIIGAWAAGIALLVFLPAAGFFSVMAMVSYSARGWHGQPAVAAPPPVRFNPPVAPAPRSAPAQPQRAAAPPNGEPAMGGNLVTLWDGKQSVSNGQIEFSLDYRLDGLRVSPDAQYFWVIVDRAGAKVEFPIPSDVLKPRDHLSGQPKGATAGQFQPPFRSFLQRQAPGMSQRDTISNTIEFPGG